MQLKQLEEDIASITRRQLEIAERSDESGVPMTAEEIKQIDDWEAEKGQKKELYESETRKVALRAQRSLTPDASYGPRNTLVTERDRNLADKGWLLYRAGAEHLLTNDMKLAMERCGTRTNSKELVLRAQTIGTPSQGGYLRQPNAPAPVTKALGFINGIRNYCRIWTTSNTNTQSFPFVDYTARKSKVKDELEVFEGEAVTLTNTTIGVKKHQGAVFEISYESVMDTNNEIMTLVWEALAFGQDHFEAEATCIGNGSGDYEEIYGFTDSATGFLDSSVEPALSNDVSFSETWAFRQSVPAPYLNERSIAVMNGNTIGALHGKTDGFGRPVVAANWQVGPTLMFHGIPIVRCDFMPDMEAGAGPICIMDPFYFVMREVTDGTRLRLSEELYWTKDALAASISKFIGSKVVNRNAGRILRMPE